MADFSDCDNAKRRSASAPEPLTRCSASGPLTRCSASGPRGPLLLDPRYRFALLAHACGSKLCPWIRQCFIELFCLFLSQLVNYMITSMYVAYQTSNVAAVIEVRSANFGLVFHAQYIFYKCYKFSRHRLQSVTIFHFPYFVYTV